MQKSNLSYNHTVILSFFLYLIIAPNLIGQNFTLLQNQGPITNKGGDHYSTSIIDIDNNYTLDVIVGNSNNGSHSLYINDGNGSFLDSSTKSVVSQSSAGFAAWGDYNNDCLTDVYWTTNQAGSAPFFSNNGNRNFSSSINTASSSSISSVAAAWADIDNNGDLDLFVANMSNGAHHLYINDGNGNFTKIDTGVFALCTGGIQTVSWGDVENDGDADLFLGNTTGNNYLLINHGNAHFEIDTASIVSKEGTGTSTASWGDYDGDGYLDLFVGRFNLQNFLYHNNGNGTFSKVTSGTLLNDSWKTYSSKWADLDNDGDLDLFQTTSGNGLASPNKNVIYKNTGGGSFTKVNSGSVYLENRSSTGCGIADINNDGALDILIANRSGFPISIHENNGSPNNFVKLGLFGSSANRLAIGARIEISSAIIGKQTLYLGDASRVSPNFETHFGLGQDTIIDTLRIYWPSNNVCTLTNVPVNAFYNIGELTCSLDSLVSPGYSDSTSFLSAHFSNLSGGSISGYEWSFGDGQTSTQTNPVHHYSQAGKYEVTLKVFDNFCKSVVLKDSIEICPDTAQLGFYTSKQGTSVTFIDTSISNGYSFQWNYGDGNTGSGIVTSHQYANAGNYNVCLYVTDSCRIDTLCQTVTVCNDTLTAAFGHTSSVLNVSFIDSSVNATSIIWDFGDGTTDTSSNPNHTYTAPGYYTVCQTVMDVCTSTTTCKVIGVCLDTALAKFSYSDTLNTITLTSNSQNANSYLWNFGDGNLSTNQNPTHTYQQYGSYTVCLIVTNDCYSDTLCQNITICAVKGVANYTYQHIGKSLTVQFQNRSTNAQSYRWDFGDGNLSTSKNPLVVYNRAWVYNVCLTVVDTCGKEDTYCQQLNMMPFSIDELTLLESIKIYPNPADDILKIELPNEMKFSTTVSLYDLNGKLLIAKNINKNQKGVNLDLSSLAKGVYMLNLNMEGASRQMKIVKN